MSSSVFLATTERQVRETQGMIGIEVRRAGALDQAVTVTFTMTGDTATAGLDFVAATGTVTLEAGSANAFIPVTLINDLIGEGTERFTVQLVSAEGGTLLAPRTTRVAILDDETPADPLPPAVLYSDYTLGFTPVLSGLEAAVRFDFDPSDPSRLFIIEKNGRLKLGDLDTGQVTTLLDITERVNDHDDRGLLGLALHPDFATTPYVYLYYSVDPPETAGLTGNAGPDGAGNRYAVLERFLFDQATGQIVPGSGVVMLGGAARGLVDVNGGGALNFTDPVHAGEAASDRFLAPGDTTPVIGGIKQGFIKADSVSHIGGHMMFGADGALYLATGDAVSFNFADPRAADVLNLDSLSGKILRLDPITGLGLPDNPFAFSGVDLDANRAKVFQLGLRNPFSFAKGPEGQIVIADVGQTVWEEINIGGPGANFGWPWFEGGDGTLARTPGYRDFADAAAFYDAVAAGTITVTPSLRAFSHDGAEGGFRIQAIIGGSVVYNGPHYPAEFQNDFFFMDFEGGEFFSVDIGDRAALRYLGEVPGLIHLRQGPDGWIYGANIFTGEVTRLSITPAPPFVPPVQQLAAIGAASLLDAARGEYQLTPSDTWRAGGVASTTRIDLRQDARFVFELNFGNQDAAGADGAAFVLHNDPFGLRALGRPGGELGVGGLRNGVVIEFDTWNNGGDDIEADHGAIHAPNTPGFGFGERGVHALPNLEDGTWHRVEVRWTAATGTLTYSLGGVERDTRQGGVIETALGGSPFAHLLLTGATGGMPLEHRVRVIETNVTYEDIAGNQAPVLFGGARPLIDVTEGVTGAVLRPQASDAEGQALTWRIAGGPDAARFTIDPSSGALSFGAVPDFASPLDANGDNIYGLVIEVRDALGATARQSVFLRVSEAPLPREGSAAGERLDGTRRADSLLGVGGNDLLNGGAGHDTLRGGEGDDRLIGGLGADLLDGGAGFDAVLYSAARMAIGLDMATRGFAGEAEGDVLIGIERVVGSAFGDTLRGNAEANRFEGGQGHDWLEGQDGDDWLHGGEGRDTLLGGVGRDTLFGGEGDDVLEGGAARDVLDGGAGADRFVWRNAADSRPAEPDWVRGFVPGEDVLDLRGLGFDSFVGTAVFTGTGELRATAVAPGAWRVEGNVSGSLAPEFALIVQSSATPEAGWFLF